MLFDDVKANKRKRVWLQHGNSRAATQKMEECGRCVKPQHPDKRKCLLGHPAWGQQEAHYFYHPTWRYRGLHGLIHGETEKIHDQRLAEALRDIEAAGLKLKKAKFKQKQVSFLGHIIEETGIRPNPDKAYVQNAAKSVRFFCSYVT